MGAIYSRVAERHGIRLAVAEADRRFSDAWRSHKKSGETVDKSLWRKIIEAVFHDHKVPDTEAFFHDLYDSFREPSSWALYPDAIPALTALKERGIRLAIASNWDERLPELLDAIGLTPFFEQRYISYALEVSKPDTRFFQAALSGMGVEAHEAVHVGDDPEEDIKGAEAAGIRAYLINRKVKPLNSRMIVSLEEMLVRV